MGKRTKIKVYTGRLPSTPVTEGMKNSMVEVATKEGQSVSEMTRRAIELFLSTNYSKTQVDISKAIKNE